MPEQTYKQSEHVKIGATLWRDLALGFLGARHRSSTWGA